MKYVEVINKYRKPTITGLDRQVSCWAPFQSIHINKRGEIKVCPFTMRKEVIRIHTTNALGKANQRRKIISR